MAPPSAPGTASRQRRYPTRSPYRRRERRQFEDDPTSDLEPDVEAGNGEPNLGDDPTFDTDTEGDSGFDSGDDSDPDFDLDIDDPAFDPGNDGSNPEPPKFDEVDPDPGVDGDPDFFTPPPSPAPSPSIPPPPPPPPPSPTTPPELPLTTPSSSLEQPGVSAITTYTVYDSSLSDDTQSSELQREVVVPWSDYSGTMTGAITLTPSEATVTKSASAGSGTVSTVTVSPTSTDIDMEFNRDGYLEDMGNKSSDTKRHVMIGGASIGTFIGICIFAWLAWRVTRARKQGRRGTDGSPWPRFSRQARAGRVLGRLPWVRRYPWAQRWQNLDDEDTMPITREKTGSDRSSGLLGRFVPDEKAGARAVPPLDTRYTDRMSQQTISSDNDSLLSAATSVPSPVVVASHQPQPSYNSLEAQGGTWAYLAAPDPQYHQLQHRASNLTSLSSGFGDGDIIIPPAFHPPRSGASTPQPAPSMRTTSSAGNALSNRDTIYTATSDDQPARFRTVSSWVNQQKGRIHRAQQRVRDGNAVVGEREGVPPVPGVPAGAGVNGLPPEQEFSLMMPDGEVPRRPDDMGLK